MPPPPPPSRWRGVVGLVGGLLVLGAAAAGGTVSHQQVSGAARWPTGLALALALTVCCAIFWRTAFPAATARFGAGLGWVAVALLGAQSPPGGDLLVPGNGRGYAWLGLGLLSVVVVLVLPAPRPARATVRQPG